MKPIPFTQYRRPNGRRTSVAIDMPEDVADKAATIIEKGLVFECEELSTGICSFTITDPEKGDIAIELAPNGPEVIVAITKLITEFSL